MNGGRGGGWRGDRRKGREKGVMGVAGSGYPKVGNTQISILLLCFLYLFVELMIMMNNKILFKPKCGRRGQPQGWWWSRASCPRMSVDILGTNCDQCLSMVQCCFTSTETVRLIRTESPGRPPRLSHSSWTLHPRGRDEQFICKRCFPPEPGRL